MRISAKTRYGLAAVIRMAESADQTECMTVIRMAQHLKISKIYLEQVFALLKRGGIVHSVQGAQGGYFLSRPASKITAYDVLAALELSLFEKTSDTVAESDTAIEEVMHTKVFGAMDLAVQAVLSGVTLQALADQAESLHASDNYMYYL